MSKQTRYCTKKLDNYDGNDVSDGNNDEEEEMLEPDMETLSAAIQLEVFKIGFETIVTIIL